MREIRKDPIIGRWVIISTERAKRPTDFPRKEVKQSAMADGLCPLCEGNERFTPSEIFSFRDPGSLPNGPGWSVRVVPNKFPVLRVEEELDREGWGLFDKVSGMGAHEVVIETPRHQEFLPDMQADQIQKIFLAFRQRIWDLSQDQRIRYTMIFKNHGFLAGAPIAHSHSQIIGLPIVPKLVMEEMIGGEEHYQLKERCIFCDILHQELQEKERLIYENESFVCLSPFAPRFPFEVWVLPKIHSSSFELSSDEELLHLGELFQTLMRGLFAVLDHPDFNFILHTAPLRKTNLEYYHWHIEIMPKLTKVAGFEWGSGFFINEISPEKAADVLREAIANL